MLLTVPSPSPLPETSEMFYLAVAATNTALFLLLVPPPMLLAEAVAIAAV